MTDRIAARSGVVPLETFAQVVRDSDVMPRGISLTPENVDNPLFDFVHASRRRTDQASTESVRFRRSVLVVRAFGETERDSISQ